MSVQAADLVLENAAVYTVDYKRSWAQALAISGDRIVYVGPNSGVQAYKGHATKVMVLTGKMVLPGFCESHAHPSAAMAMVLSVNLYRLRSLDEYTAKITEFVEQHPEMGIIRGAGWSNTLFPAGGPRRAAHLYL